MQYTYRDLPWLIDLYFNLVSADAAASVFQEIQEINCNQDAYQGVRVTHGEIIVESIELIIDEPNVKVWEGDFRSKYVDFAYVSNPLQIMLYASDRTLYLDDKHIGRATYVDTGLSSDDGWRMIAQCARYSLYLCAYRYPVECPGPRQP
jgi:hypothetical protein